MSKLVKVTVNRAFFINGETQEAGAKLEIDSALAIELKGYGKVEISATEEAPVKKTKPKTETQNSENSED